MSSLDFSKLPASLSELKFTKHIQSGAFGAVWGAEHPTGKRVAVKVQKKNCHMVEHEARVMRALAPHPHILKCHGVHPSSAGKGAALVTELCDGDLLDKISAARRLGEAEAMPIFRDILVAVAHMHKHDVYHCDLKPENVLLVGKSVRVADFGASAVGSTFTARNLGSAQYLCPELLSWHEGDIVNFASGDVWSLGVVLFTMLAGYQPWNQPTTRDLHFSQFVSGTMRFPSCVSSEAAQFLLAMLSLDPRDRPSVAELLRWPIMQAVSTEAAPAAAPASKAAAASNLTVTTAGHDDPRLVTLAADLACEPLSVRSASGESKQSSSSGECTPKVVSPTARRHVPLGSIDASMVDDDDDESDEEDAPYCVTASPCHRPVPGARSHSAHVTTYSVRDMDIEMARD